MSRLLALICFMLCLSAAAQSNLPPRPSIDAVATILRANLEQPPEGFISYFWPDEENALLYVDVNGDGEEDLIANGWLFVAVFLWQGDSYSTPFQLIETANPDSGAWSKVSFLDYTLDDSPEILLDIRKPYIGRNRGGNQFERAIIHCDSECRLIWQGEIADYFWVNGSEVGMYLLQTELSSYWENNQLWLEQSRQDFAFNCRLPHCRTSQEQPSADLYSPASRVGALLKVRYLWDGLRFNFFETVNLRDSHPLAPQSQISASYADKAAEISIGDSCQVILNEQLLGETFPCLLDFSRLEWRDITGDSIPELLLEYAYFDTETLVVYSMAGQEIGRISAAIRVPDLFGIRVLENGILSAGQRYSETCDFCWYEVNQANLFFQWNGFGFEASH